jgi:hypothetical protein
VSSSGVPRQQLLTGDSSASVLTSLLGGSWLTIYDLLAMTVDSTAAAWLLSCCWLSPAQWFLVPSPVGLMTIYYCLMALGAFRPLSCDSDFNCLIHPLLHSLVMACIENIVSNSSSVVACVSIVAQTCLSNHCLAMAVSPGSTIPRLRCHVTISTWIHGVYIPEDREDSNLHSHHREKQKSHYLHGYIWVRH